MAATFENIIAEMKKGIFKPVYFLAGEEPYYIDVISDYIEEKDIPKQTKPLIRQLSTATAQQCLLLWTRREGIP